jgi:hypothetical protein
MSVQATLTEVGFVSGPVDVTNDHGGGLARAAVKTMAAKNIAVKTTAAAQAAYELGDKGSACGFYQTAMEHYREAHQGGHPKALARCLELLDRRCSSYYGGSMAGVYEYWGSELQEGIAQGLPEAICLDAICKASSQYSGVYSKEKTDKERIYLAFAAAHGHAPAANRIQQINMRQKAERVWNPMFSFVNKAREEQTAVVLVQPISRFLKKLCREEDDINEVFLSIASYV